MGFGACKKKVRRMRRRPPGAPPLTEEQIEKRIHCNFFYWNAASAVVKTACLGLFLVVESPRRIDALLRRQPEPKPFVNCSRFGYRLCACNHHFYDHMSVAEQRASQKKQREALQAADLQIPGREVTTADLKMPGQDATDKPAERKRRKRFWLF